MCNPIALGIAATVAGGALRGAQSRRYTNALNDANMDAYLMSRAARESEIARQDVWEDQAAEAWAAGVEKASPSNYDVTHDQQVQQFLTEFDQPDPQDGVLLTGQENGSSEIQDTIYRKTNQAAQEARERIAALASLTGYDSTASTRGRDIGNTANTLAGINTLRRGSLGVSNFEQNIPPAQVFEPTYLLADILSGIGGVTTGMPWYAMGQNTGTNPINLLAGTPYNGIY